MAHILVVDDNPMNVRVCRLILERYGHVVSTETNPQTALQQMESALPDLLITDLMMPILDGYALTERVRALPGGDTLPIIVLTARGESTAMNRAMRAGVNAYLTKPVSSGALSEAVDAALGGRCET